MAKDVEHLMRWLPTIALFGGLQEPTLRRLIQMMGVHRCQSGEEIIKQGEAGRALFIVFDGEVMVAREGDSRRRIKMIRLGPGEFFGEMSLIDIQKRSASVIVQTPSVLYSLGNRDLYQLYLEDVPGYVMVLQNLCRELSRRLRTTNARLSTMAMELNSADATLLHPVIKK